MEKCEEKPHKWGRGFFLHMHFMKCVAPLYYYKNYRWLQINPLWFTLFALANAESSSMQITDNMKQQLNHVMSKSQLPLWMNMGSLQTKDVQACPGHAGVQHKILRPLSAQ